MTMSNTNVIRELKLHSPAGVEPALFTWPNIEQQQQVTKKDGAFVGGDEIVKTIRLVFEGTKSKHIAHFVFLIQSI